LRTGRAAQVRFRILERLCESSDDGERCAQLMRHVGNEVAAHGFEPAHRGEIEESEHGAAARERPRRERNGRSADCDFRALGLGPPQSELDRVSERGVARKDVHTEWNRGPQ